MGSSYQLRLQEALSALQRNTGIFAQIADELRAIATQLSGTAQSLLSGTECWQGDGAKAFQAAWERYSSDSQHVSGELEAITPVLRDLATLLESALAVANEIERLDPVSASWRLGLPVPHVIENIERSMIDEAIDALLRTDAMRADTATAGDLEGIIGWIGTIGGDLDSIIGGVAKTSQDLDGLDSFMGDIDPWLAAFGVLLQFASGSQHDWRTFEIDAVGGIIQFLIGRTPPGLIIEAVAAAIQITSIGLAVQQDFYASMYPGELGSELKDPANTLWTTADNADFTKVCDDAAKLIIDTNGTILLASSNPGIFAMSIEAGYLNDTFGWHIPGATSPTTLFSDSSDLLKDSGKLVLSPIQLAVNSQVMKADDRLADLDTIVQNMPLPGSIKNTWNQDTINVIHGINGVSDFVSKPDGIEHLEAIAQTWLTH